jgi:Kef-type K+ transport system membrane component KefB
VLLAGAAPAAEVPVTTVLVVLAAILIAAKALGEVAERLGQPAVVGELIAGVLLGPSILGLVDPTLPVLHVLAEVGVLILLFHIGLETDLKRLLAVGGVATVVALVGVALPFALGYVVAMRLGLEPLPALVVGASLTATSVGITARVLADLGRLQDRESQVVLGAAVLDDIVGLIILAVVVQIVGGASLSVGSITITTAIAFGFVAAALLVGRLAVPPVFGFLARIGSEQALATFALALAFLTAVLADRVGSALIIGAFTAGLAFAPTVHAKAVERGVVRLGHFFVPIFFVSVGAAVDVRTFAESRVIVIGLALVVVGVVGKVAAGYAPFWFKGRKAVIGVGMVPRGEVGLIFAQTGRTAGVLDPGLYAAITFMVIVTTLLAPPVLKRMLGPARGRAGDDRPGELVHEA